MLPSSPAAPTPMAAHANSTRLARERLGHHRAAIVLSGLALWIGSALSASNAPHALPGPVAQTAAPAATAAAPVATPPTRSAITHSKHPSEWLQQLLVRRPKNVVLLALANKTARVVWALLSKEVEYSETLYSQVS